MSDADAIREAARDALRELLPELLRETSVNSVNGNGHSHAVPAPDTAVIPQVPAPPVAAVLRPSTWSGPATPGEVVGDNSVYARETSQTLVSIESDDDLNQFVQALAARLEDPREREAIRSGAVRFTLGAGAPPQSAAAVRRIERGAVTERVVREAAAAGARLVLAPAAVLTPLARDQARKLGVEIEKERTC